MKRHRVVAEAFDDETASLKALPIAPCRTVLRLERRASHEGMVSIGGSLYGVPDTTRRRVFEVHVLADQIRILEDKVLVAIHAPLEQWPIMLHRILRRRSSFGIRLK